MERGEEHDVDTSITMGGGREGMSWVNWSTVSLALYLLLLLFLMNRGGGGGGGGTIIIMIVGGGKSWDMLRRSSFPD